MLVALPHFFRGKRDPKKLHRDSTIKVFLQVWTRDQRSRGCRPKGSRCVQDSAVNAQKRYTASFCGKHSFTVVFLDRAQLKDIVRIYFGLNKQQELEKIALLRAKYTKNRKQSCTNSTQQNARGKLNKFQVKRKLITNSG